MTTPRPHPDPHLRSVLHVNAFFSGVSGAFALLASTWLGELSGLRPGVMQLLGAGLVLFAADVTLSARASRERLVVFARAIGVADATWVVATAVAIAMGVFTTGGAAVATIVAVVVATFAVLEFRGAAAIGERQRGMVTATT